VIPPPRRLADQATDFGARAIRATAAGARVALASAGEVSVRRRLAVYATRFAAPVILGLAIGIGVALVSVRLG
jgi:hypothetical protein